MDIQEFLLARIAEDEVTAREEDDDYADTTLLPTYDSGHQAKWNTARVLAECAAKRAIVELHDYDWMGPDDAAGKGCEHDYEEWPCPTIRALAAVYSDHPDYQQEWAA